MFIRLRRALEMPLWTYGFRAVHMNEEKISRMHKKAKSVIHLDGRPEV